MKNRLSIKNIKIINIVIFFISIAILFILLRTNKAVIKEVAHTDKKLSSVDVSTWDKSKVTEYKDSDGKIAPIPIGYSVSQVPGENKISTGLVIYEGTASVTSAPTSGSSVISSAQATRNQWVWIPVPDVDRIYTQDSNGVKKAKLWQYSATGRTLIADGNHQEPGILTAFDNEYYFSRNNMQGDTRESFLQKMQIEYDRTIESIKKYGGFYIGRYETGDLSKKVPVVRKMNTDISQITWYTAYNKLQYLGANQNVKTHTMWGSFHDEVVQWLIDSNCKTYSEIADSTNWGNHLNSSFSYTTTTGGSANKASGTYTIVPTGSAEVNKANNIYDLAGNEWEWLAEAYQTNKRRSHGGGVNYHGSSYSVSSRAVDGPVNTFYYLGFRAYMYIK